MKKMQKFQTGKSKQTVEGTENQIIQNDLEYAGDTQLLMGRDTHEQMCERIGNYDIETETRDLKIRCAKVDLLRLGRNKPTQPLPPPFDHIKQGIKGTILGKEISTNGGLTKSVAARIA